MFACARWRTLLLLQLRLLSASALVVLQVRLHQLPLLLPPQLFSQVKVAETCQDWESCHRLKHLQAQEVLVQLCCFWGACGQ